MDIREIQKYVDHYLFFGLIGEALATQLYGQHGIPKSQFIPKPSKAALNSYRRWLKAEGPYPKKFVKDDIPHPTLQGVKASTIGEVSPEPSKGEGISSTAVSHSKVVSEIDRDILVDCIYRPDTVTPAQVVDALYSSIGKTTIDRIINGFAPMAKKIIKKEGSPYELVDALINRISPEFFDFSKASVDSLYENGQIMEPFLRMMFPWFSEKNKTTNLQISDDFAEKLFEANKDFKIPIIKLLPGEYFFLDIKASSDQSRYISCVTSEHEFLPDGRSGIRMNYIVEWSGLGYESLNTLLIDPDIKPDRNVNNGFCDSSAMVIEGRYPVELTLDELGYEDILHKAITLTCSAWSFYHNNRNSIIENDSALPRKNKSLNKRLSNKPKKALKTLSNGSFFKIESPKIDAVSTNRSGTGWKLNYLIKVKGYFRMQSYGPGNKNKKLIWVDEYDKGVGHQVRPGVGHKIRKRF